MIDYGEREGLRTVRMLIDTVESEITRREFAFSESECRDERTMLDRELDILTRLHQTLTDHYELERERLTTKEREVAMDALDTDGILRELHEVCDVVETRRVDDDPTEQLAHTLSTLADLYKSQVAE